MTVAGPHTLTRHGAGGAGRERGGTRDPVPCVQPRRRAVRPMIYHGYDLYWSALYETRAALASVTQDASA